jgi:hypothetical protein
MSDDRVAALLDSDTPLVVIEAPAGCGKTYQGAGYARRASSGLETGRVLILTHTHAACGVFAKETSHDRHRVEIRTIDSLIVQIASAYHRSLALPADVSAWAQRDPEGGYDKLADRVARLLSCQPMVCESLVRRYPVVIGDEHQDSNAGQHALIMALQEAGARTRIFGDPRQGLYPERAKSATAAHRTRWDELKETGAYDELSHPHRWDDGSPELGRWVLEAREALIAGRPIDLSGLLPAGLNVLLVENRSPKRTGFLLSDEDRAPLDRITNAAPGFLILTGEKDTVTALRAFWNRKYPIWEGHVRDDLGQMVAQIAAHPGDAPAIAQATVDFVSSVAAGFGASTHGNLLVKEVSEGCTKRRRDKPALLQRLGHFILEQPDHVGVAKCLTHLAQLIEDRFAGFERIKIDQRREFRDALRLIEFDDPEEGLTEIARRRSFAHPMPPAKAISTIHKAKGLQSDHAIVVPCDRARFSATDYSKCKLYVALSRAKCSLTLVVSRNDPSPLFHLRTSQ